MSDKLLAGIVAAAVISPICAVCILGPAAIGSLVAGTFGWIGGFGPLATIALMIATGALIYRHYLRKQARALTSHRGSSNTEHPVSQAEVDANRSPDDRVEGASGQVQWTPPST